MDDYSKLKKLYDGLLFDSFKLRARVQQLENQIQANEDEQVDDCERCPSCMERRIKELEAQLDNSVPKKTMAQKIKKIKAKYNQRIAMLSPPAYSRNKQPPPPYQ